MSYLPTPGDSSRLASDVFSQIITKLRDTDHSAEIQSGKLETN